MQVSAVQSNYAQYNTNPAFKGSVSRTLNKFIDGCVKNELEQIASRATQEGRNVDLLEVSKVYDFAKKLKTKFSTYMKAFHGDTKLRYVREYPYREQSIEFVNNNFPYKSYPEVSIRLGHIPSNKLSDISGNEIVNTPFLEPVKNSGDYFEFIKANMTVRELVQLDKWITEVADKVKPRDIDVSLVNQMKNRLANYDALKTDLWSRIVSMSRAGRADYVASDIKMPVQDAMTIRDNTLDKALTKKAIERANKKAIKNKN